MTRQYGRVPRGELASDAVPRNRGSVTSMIGGLTLRGGLEAMMTIEGGTDGDVFVAFLSEVLGPVLRDGDLVVMDNVGAHRDKRVAVVLASFGAKPVYLPPYSPDMNPIELAWSHLKDYLRGARARTVEVLNNCIDWGMRLVAPEVTAGLFRHCGYLGRPS